MTLHTRVKVTTPGIDPRATFIKMRQIIGAGDQYDAWESPDPESDNEYRRTMAPGFHMSVGQGLPALMWVEHNNGDLMPPEDWHAEHADDTAYGYRADNNASCSDLHAWITQEIGAWLDAQGASWQWYDESGDGWDHGPGWGTLGDPEVGALGSTIQRVNADEKRAFWAFAMAAIAAAEATR